METKILYQVILTHSYQADSLEYYTRTLGIFSTKEKAEQAAKANEQKEQAEYIIEQINNFTDSEGDCYTPQEYEGYKIEEIELDRIK